jgi:hypothetical protein
MTRFSLQDPDLFRRQAYLAGRWCDADKKVEEHIQDAIWQGVACFKYENRHPLSH